MIPGQVVDLLTALPGLVLQERLGRGLTVREAAGQAGVTPSVFSLFERGLQDARVSTVVAMLRWLG